MNIRPVLTSSPATGTPYSKQMLVDLVTQDNPKLSLTAPQVEFEDVLPNYNAAVLRNTHGVMRAVPGAGFKNQSELYYNRGDLTMLFSQVRAEVHVPVDAVAPYTNHDLLPLVNARYETHFEPCDIIQQPVDLTVAEGVVEMRAVGGNPAYFNVFQLRYIPGSLGAQELAVVWVNTSLQGFNLPSGAPGKAHGSIYSYNLDGSATPQGYWGGLPYGAVPPTIAAQFNTLEGVGVEWVYDDQVAACNLAGAQVVYNGPNDPAALHAQFGGNFNPVYRHVVVLQLSETLCSNFGGYLTVYHAGRV